MGTDRAALRLTPKVAALLASVAGAGVSIYLTAEHYAGVAPACPVGSTVNCEAVLSSAYAVIAGSAVPTSAAGVVWFVVSALLWARDMPRAQLAWSVVGLAAVVYLIFVEIVLVGAICLWCTATHALVVAIFIIALMRFQAAA